jgi:outer membrane protein TolC
MAQSDTIAFPVKLVLDIVSDFHPTRRQAELLTKSADMNLRMARGSFDPKFFLENNNKQFQNKNYYDILHTGLKVPTWFGLEGQLGYEQALGTNLDPSELLPSSGLSYAGLSMPLLRGLLTDQRRTALAMAKVQVQSTVFERQTMLNLLCAEVLAAYVQWYGSYLEHELYSAATRVGTLRLDQVKQSVQAGERARIDTLENEVLRRNFAISRDAAGAKMFKSALELSVHLWNAQGEPLEIGARLKPTALGLEVLDSMAEAWSFDRMRGNLPQIQPLLQEQNLNLNLYSLERKLKQQALLPELNLKYNFLTEGMYRPNPAGVPYWNNYRWGITAQTSLFLRKERAAFSMADVKLEQAQIKYRLKVLETTRKLQACWNMYVTYSKLEQDYRQVVGGYQALLDAELARLSAGESTLFLVNTREIRLLESKLKLVEYQTARYRYALDYLRESGQLWRFLP